MTGIDYPVCASTTTQRKGSKGLPRLNSAALLRFEPLDSRRRGSHSRDMTASRHRRNLPGAEFRGNRHPDGRYCCQNRLLREDCQGLGQTNKQIAAMQGGEKVRTAEEVRRYEHELPSEPFQFVTDYFLNCHETVQLQRYEYGSPGPPPALMMAICGVCNGCTRYTRGTRKLCKGHVMGMAEII